MRISRQGADWASRLLATDKRDIVSAYFEGRLTYGGQPLRLSAIDAATTRLSALAVERRKVLVVTYPFPYCPVAPLVAAAILVSELTRERETPHKYRPEPGCVILHTDRTEVRADYLKFTAGVSMPLYLALGLYRVRRDGSLALVTPPGASPPKQPQPRLLVTPDLNRVSTRVVGRVVAVISECFGGRASQESQATLEAARRLGAEGITFVFNDPFDPAVEALSSAGAAVWRWDRTAVAEVIPALAQVSLASPVEVDPFSACDRQAMRLLEGVKWRWVECGSSEVAAAERRVWEDLRDLEAEFERGDIPARVRWGLRVAYQAYNAMRRVPVPLRLYEEEVAGVWGVSQLGPLLEEVRDALQYVRREAPRLTGGMWESLVEDLQDLRNALWRKNPKFETLAQRLCQAAAERRRVFVACPNHAVERVLRLALAAYAGMHWIEAVGVGPLGTTRDIRSLADVDELILTSAPTYRERCLYFVACSPEVTVLSLPEEAGRGPQFLEATHRELASAAATDRERCWLALTGSEISMSPAAQRPRPVVQQVLREPKRSQSTHKSVWSPFRNLDFEGLESHDAYYRDERDTLSSNAIEPGDSEVMARVVRLGDGSVLLAEPGSMVTILLRGVRELDERAVESLRPGDVIVVVDGLQRRQVFDLLLDRLQRDPRARPLWVDVHYWQSTLRRRTREKGHGPEEVLREIQARGSRIRTATAVRMWLNGTVMGPDDPEDLRRVGEAYGDPVLMVAWREIGRSLERVRIMNRVLGRWLSRVIVEAGTGQGDEVLDPELGLFADDFRDAVKTYRVAAVEERLVRVPASSLGIVQRVGG